MSVKGPEPLLSLDKALGEVGMGVGLWDGINPGLGESNRPGKGTGALPEGRGWGEEGTWEKTVGRGRRFRVGFTSEVVQ